MAIVNRLKRTALFSVSLVVLASCGSGASAYANCFEKKTEEIKKSPSWKTKETLRCDKPELRLWKCTSVEKALWEVAEKTIYYQTNLAEVNCNEETGYEG
jgi:hypothetical protein